MVRQLFPAAYLTAKNAKCRFASISHHDGLRYDWSGLTDLHLFDGGLEGFAPCRPPVRREPTQETEFWAYAG